MKAESKMEPEFHGGSDQNTNHLPYTSLNPSGHETILFIHGAMSSGKDWDLVTPLMPKEYHILLPDLPAHGKAASLRPFTMSTASDQLSSLITNFARGGKCHLVGFSLGAIVAADLAARYPELIETAFVTGYLHLQPTALSSLAPYFFYTSSRLNSLIPQRLVSFFMDGADMSNSSTSRPPLSYCREISAALVSSENPKSIAARTLVVAATKRGVVPSNDRVEDAQLLGQAAKKLNPDSLVVEHPGMRHPWLRQNPGLFAETVDRWIKRLELPAGFRILE